MLASTRTIKRPLLGPDDATCDDGIGIAAANLAASATGPRDRVLVEAGTGSRRWEQAVGDPSQGGKPAARVRRRAAPWV